MKKHMAAAIAVFASANALAQEPPKLWKGDVQFGYNQTEGNTDEKSVLGRINAKRQRGSWTYDITANGQNNESDGTRSAEAYFLSNRLAYDFSQFNYTFLYGGVDKDLFSGYRYQATVSAGYGRRIFKTTQFTWDAEVGPGVRVSEFEAPSDEGDGQISEAILRLSTELVYSLSETASLSQLLTVESGDQNTVSKSTTSLKTKIVGGFGLSISYILEYNETVPQETVHLDRQTAVTLVYSF
ncbi:putative salt-induced outer membrane protein [Spongiibacter sp. IMCC21906]|jgi:putative salt-induced outer membrane protein|uniref:DUF481 domain-containing protein n=1 Tax=Spongiibacter sp. IMCC21906 TaxID=1620392 RepID=UPI00062DF9E6|nr:DUF481 domain-containing protein [Spongiibacter sp. IMCC21906]AKH69038.1 putative salt-induced outer membrane protein [Spongiibacter sp. IMCC21906]